MPQKLWVESADMVPLHFNLGGPNHLIESSHLSGPKHLISVGEIISSQWAESSRLNLAE